MKAEEILRKVRYDFPQTGAIVVGLSGGADSTLLTHLLLEKYGAARLHAVHVNHGIRGAEAGRAMDRKLPGEKSRGTARLRQ